MVKALNSSTVNKISLVGSETITLPANSGDINAVPGDAEGNATKKQIQITRSLEINTGTATLDLNGRTFYVGNCSTNEVYKFTGNGTIITNNNYVLGATAAASGRTHTVGCKLQNTSTSIYAGAIQFYTAEWQTTNAEVDFSGITGELEVGNSVGTVFSIYNGADDASSTTITSGTNNSYVLANNGHNFTIKVPAGYSDWIGYVSKGSEPELITTGTIGEGITIGDGLALIGKKPEA